MGSLIITHFLSVSKYKQNPTVPRYTGSLTGTWQDDEEAEVQHLCTGDLGGGGSPPTPAHPAPAPSFVLCLEP